MHETDAARSGSAAVTQAPLREVASDAAEPPELAVDATVPVDPGPTGSLRGTVRIAKGQKLPLAPPPTVNGQPATAIDPCPPIDVHDQRTVTRAESGGLSPVHITITGMRTTPPPVPRMHDVFIDGCRLRPTMVAATRGDSVRITNRTDTALLPVLPGDRFMQGMMRGESRELSLRQLGRSVIRCNFANYCGETEVVTVSHRLYAVTDAEGSFRIDGVPLGQPLKVHAFHPLFDVTTVAIQLDDAAREKSIALLLTPKPASEIDKGKREAPAPSTKTPGRPRKPH